MVHAHQIRFLLLTLIVIAGRLNSAEPIVEQADIDRTIDLGISFLKADAIEWKANHDCVSCHHAAHIVWAMHDAHRIGRTVDGEYLAELTEWINQSGDGKISVPRPASRPRAFNTKAVYFALGLAADPSSNEETRNAIERFLKTIVSDQLDDGSFVAWTDTRPPYFGPSDDSMTGLAVLTLVKLSAFGGQAAADARQRGISWLERTPTDGDIQSLVYRIMIWQLLKRPPEQLDPLLADLIRRQNYDGGWSQTIVMESDAWATGQALTVLGQSGRKTADPVIAKGQAFLVQSQNENGSWTMTSRPAKPGDEGAKDLVPIIGGGTAWAVIGLAASR